MNQTSPEAQAWAVRQEAKRKFKWWTTLWLALYFVAGTCFLDTIHSVAKHHWTQAFIAGLSMLGAFTWLADVEKRRNYYRARAGLPNFDD